MSPFTPAWSTTSSTRPHVKAIWYLHIHVILHPSAKLYCPSPCRRPLHLPPPLTSHSFSILLNRLSNQFMDCQPLSNAQFYSSAHPSSLLLRLAPRSRPLSHSPRHLLRYLLHFLGRVGSNSCSGFLQPRHNDGHVTQGWSAPRALEPMLASPGPQYGLAPLS